MKDVSWYLIDEETKCLKQLHRYGWLVIAVSNMTGKYTSIYSYTILVTSEFAAGMAYYIAISIYMLYIDDWNRPI